MLDKIKKLFTPKRLMILGAALLLIIGLLLADRWIRNRRFISSYQKGVYKTTMEQRLLEINYPQPYVPYYNLGNAWYRMGDYGNAEACYRRALTYDLPEGTECDIRVNLALSLLQRIDYDALQSPEGPDDATVKNAIAILTKARGILCEEGCADPVGTDGHDEEAETLKQEIDELLEQLQEEEETEEDKDEDQSENESESESETETESQSQDDGSGNRQQNNSSSGNSSSKEKEVQEKLDGQREDINEARREAARRQREKEQESGSDGQDQQQTENQTAPGQNGDSQNNGQGDDSQNTGGQAGVDPLTGQPLGGGSQNNGQNNDPQDNNGQDTGGQDTDGQDTGGGSSQNSGHNSGGSGGTDPLNGQPMGGGSQGGTTGSGGQSGDQQSGQAQTTPQTETEGRPVKFW